MAPGLAENKLDNVIYVYIDRLFKLVQWAIVIGTIRGFGDITGSRLLFIIEITLTIAWNLGCACTIVAIFRDTGFSPKNFKLWGVLLVLVAILAGNFAASWTVGRVSFLVAALSRGK